MRRIRMVMEPLLASWSADWNLLGTPVSLILGCGIACTALICRFSPLSPLAQHRLMLVLPGAMALACLSANWLKTADVELFGVWYFYKTYHAHLDTAFIVGLAFGSAFALDL